MLRRSNQGYHAEMEVCNADQMRRKLSEEVARLERKLDVLKGEAAVDFSLQQTYREMIHSRKEMLGQLREH